ncbi:MAG: methyltransferase domain-containing protein [Candidatus Zixiibacteriota bacterium]
MSNLKVIESPAPAGEIARIESELTRERVLAVCEHFSFKPLISFTCLNLGDSSEPRVYFDRYFASYVNARPFEGNHRDETFDLIICDNSYQYFRDFVALADEFYRLLKTGGFCYFAGRTRGGKTSPDKNGPDRYYLSRRVLRKKLNDFWIHDYMPLIIENPAAFKRGMTRSTGSKLGLRGVLRKILTPFANEFVWVLTKKK